MLPANTFKSGVSAQSDINSTIHDCIEVNIT